MKTQRSSCPSVSVATLTHLVLVLLVSRSIDLVTGCCYCGGTEDEGCLSSPDANVNGGLIDWVSEGICGNCSSFPDTKGYCCMGLPYCAGDSRCPYSGLEEIKEWMAKPIAQRREQKAPTTVSPSPSALRTEEVIISDHEGHACFIGDDELYHPAVDDSAKLENVMFCQDLMKDGITPVTVAPAKFVLHVHHAATEFTGVGVHISTGGKFCRLAYHARRELDGRYRIVCDVDVDLPNSDNRVEMFFTALADEQLEQVSIQDSTGSYCEMGWGVRCVFRTEVTSRGKFSFQTYDHEHEQDQNTSPTPSPNVSPVAVAVPSSSEPSSIDEVKVDYDPLPYTFGDRASYCVTSADAGIWDEPPYFGVGNDYTLRECLLQAKGKRYNFIHYWADGGLCRGLYECPFEYNCDEKGDCLDSDKGVRTFTLKAIPAIDEVTTSSPTEAPLSPLPSQIPTPTNEKPLCGCQYGDYIMLDQRWSHEFWTVRGDLGYTQYHQLGFDSFGEMLNWSSYHSVDFGWKEGSSYGQLFYHSFTTSPKASESSTIYPNAMAFKGSKGVSSNVTFDSETTMLLPLSSCWDFSSNEFDSRMAFVKTSVLESHPSFKGTSALSEWNKCQLVSSSSAVGTTPSTTSGAVSAQTSPIAAVVTALVWCIL